MRNNSKRFITLLLIGVFGIISLSTPAMAIDKTNGDLDAGRIAVDALLVRPAGLLAIAVGTALFIVTIPFSALGGNKDAVYKKLVVEPVEFTLRRPLGEF